MTGAAHVIRTLEIDGTRIRAIDHGPADADPVLLVHGVGGWAETWRETQAALAGSGFRSVAIDLPGFGESERMRLRYFEGATPGYAAFVCGALDALAIPRAHLIGHSLGGAIAYLSAVCAPARCRSLVLVAPGGLGEDLAWPLRLGSLPFAPLLLADKRSAARAGLASCFHDPRRIPPALLEECDRYAARSIDEALRVLRAGVTLRGIKRSIRRRWMAAARNYTGPALVVWGEQDRVLPVGHVAHVATTFPDAAVRTIPDAGHLVMVEQPARFAAAVLPFLDDARVGSGTGAIAAAHN